MGEGSNGRPETIRKQAGHKGFKGRASWERGKTPHTRLKTPRVGKGKDKPLYLPIEED